MILLGKLLVDDSFRRSQPVTPLAESSNLIELFYKVLNCIFFFFFFSAGTLFYINIECLLEQDDDEFHSIPNYWEVIN